VNLKSKDIIVKVHFIQIHKCFIPVPTYFSLPTILRDKDYCHEKLLRTVIYSANKKYTGDK